MQASSTKIENAFTYSTAILCTCSFCCSFYVMISSSLMKRRRDKNNHQAADRNDIMFFNLIFYLSLFDSIYHGVLCFNGLYQWNLQIVTTLCTAIGVVTQICLCLMALWQVLIALYIFHLLTFWFTTFVQHKLRKTIICITICVLAIVGSIVPLFYDSTNHYRAFANYETYTQDGIVNGTYYSECWLEGSDRMIFYSTALFAIVVHLINVCIAVTKYYNYSYGSQFYSNRYWRLIGRLLAWPIFYTIILTFPLIDRILDFNPNYHATFAIALIHCCCSASVGIVNGIIWLCFVKLSSDGSDMSKKDNVIKQDDTLATTIDTTQTGSVNVIPPLYNNDVPSVLRNNKC